MNKRISKHVLRLFAACVVLALPILGAVLIRVHDCAEAIAHLDREKLGLQADIIADDLLISIEHYRIDLLNGVNTSGPGRAEHVAEVDKAFRELRTAPISSVSNAGPRIKLAALEARWVSIRKTASKSARAQATIPLAESILSLLLDIGDASGLTYDPTVDSINLSDAIGVRLPSQSERRDQGADTIERARLRAHVEPVDIVAAETSSGQARDALSAGMDDVDGAAEAIPMLGPALHQTRSEVERTAERLSSAIDADALDNNPPLPAQMREMRLASIRANEQLVHFVEPLLVASFNSRIASYRGIMRETLGLGIAALTVSFAVIVMLSHAVRRRDRLALAHANERAEALETQLARRNAERALRMTEQQFRAVFDGSHVGIAIIDRSGRRVDANDALRAMFDSDVTPVVEIAQHMLVELERDDRHALRSEHRFQTRADRVLWAEVSLSLIRDDAADTALAILLVHDITQHKTMYERLDHETLHDELTGLPNRVHFMRRLEVLVKARIERFAIVFLDLDNFKLVNDTLGHHDGDQLLQLVAKRLTDAVRPCDFVARLHGDEFAIMLIYRADSDNSQIEHITARLQQTLQVRVDTVKEPIIVTASIGVAYCTEHDRRDASQLLRDADAAMYRSKIAGRNQTTFYDPPTFVAEQLA